MPPSFIKFNSASFTYQGAASPLFSEVTLHTVSGWTGVIGANGTGKTTLLKLATGILTPQQGQIDHPSRTVYCPQRTDDMPPNFADFLSSYSKLSFKLREQLQVSEDWLNRWLTLSHGERKRAQIATALWQQPTNIAAYSLTPP